MKVATTALLFSRIAGHFYYWIPMFTLYRLGSSLLSAVPIWLCLVALCYSSTLQSAPSLSATDDFSADETELLQKPSIQSLLNNVVNASRYYSYTGLLTYEANGSLNTLSLHQRIDNSGEHSRVYQTLEFLDGASRRVVREQGLQTCEVGKTRWGLWPRSFNVDELLQYYQITIQALERVANRTSWVVDFVPKDTLRYGYRLNIDQQTGLLLRSIILEKTTIVERTQFVSMNLYDEDMESSLVEQDTISWRVPEVEPCHTEQFQSAWAVSWLPEGFASVGNRVTAKGEQVLMFSDGLVSISVFIGSQRYENLPKITARRGATSAVMSPLLFDRLKTVSVVGEVPIVTARRIAVSVKPR